MMHSSTPQPPEPLDSDGTIDGVGAFIDAVVAAPEGHHPTTPLSDLDRPAVALLRRRWGEIPASIRARLTRAMVADAEDHVERHYSRAFMVACGDDDPDVRLAAFDGLWESEAPELLALLLNRITEEPDVRVREAMAIGLGRFASAHVDDDETIAIRDALFERFASDPALDVRRRALESLGFMVGDDIVETIEDAYADMSVEMQASALHAMGRQADGRWVSLCVDALGSDDPELRYEAVTALGSIGAPGSVPAIIDVTEDEDVEVVLAAIAALGETGGAMAINQLRRLVQSDDPAIAEAAEDALQEAAITASPLRPPM